MSCPPDLDAVLAAAPRAAGDEPHATPRAAPVDDPRFQRGLTLLEAVENELRNVGLWQSAPPNVHRQAWDAATFTQFVIIPGDRAQLSNCELPTLHATLAFVNREFGDAPKLRHLRSLLRQYHGLFHPHAE